MARTVLIEALLFLSPFAIYAVVLYATSRDAREAEYWTTRILAALAAIGMVLMIIGLVFFAHFGGAPPGAEYEPAHMENGKLVPGRLK
jgi:hypothetical protein